MNDAILAEVHQAIRTLGGVAEPRVPVAAARVLRALDAPADLRSIIDSWQDHTLDEELVLEMLCDWNAGRPLFKEVFAPSEGTKPH